MNRRSSWLGNYHSSKYPSNYDDHDQLLLNKIVINIFTVTTTLLLLSHTINAAAAAAGSGSDQYSSSDDHDHHDDVIIVDVVRYGAVGNGKTDNSAAFLKAWEAACSSSSSSNSSIIMADHVTGRKVTIRIPAGTFLLYRPIAFSGPCKTSLITFQIDGNLVATADYKSYATKQYWIQFKLVKGIRVHGGYFDGRGTALWACKAAGSGDCPFGATSLFFENCEDVGIYGVTLVNPQLFHLVINDCINVQVAKVKIFASGTSPNTDGIHVQGSTAVTITYTSIKTGDDCISIGPGTNGLWIEQVYCGPGHGISIGSLGKDAKEAGVQNITVKNTRFAATQNGLRIKTWARMSSGFVKGVLFENAVMQDVGYPIIITQNYCPHNLNCPKQGSGVKISGVKFENIRGTSATQVAVSLDCSPKAPCNDIHLAQVHLTYKNNLTAKATCENVAFGTTRGLMLPAVGCLAS